MPPAPCPSCLTSQDFTFDAQAGGLACPACGCVLDDLQVLGRDDDGPNAAGRESFRFGAEAVQSRQARLVAAQTDNGVNRGDYARRREHEWDVWMRGVLHACRLGGLLQRVQLRFGECRVYARRKQAEQDEMEDRGVFVPEHERVNEITWGRQAELYGLGCAYIAAVQSKADLTLPQLLDRANRPPSDSPQLHRAILHISHWLGPPSVEFGPELLLDRIHKYTHDTLALNKPRLLGSARADWHKGSLKWARAADLQAAKELAGELVGLGRGVRLHKGREPEQVAVAAFVMAVEAVVREKAPSLADWFEHLSHAFGGKAYTVGERYREFDSFLLDKVVEHPLILPTQAPNRARKKRLEVPSFSALLIKLLVANYKRGTPDLSPSSNPPVPSTHAESPLGSPLLAPANADDYSATQDLADSGSDSLDPSPAPYERLTALYEIRELDKHGKRPAKYMSRRAGPIKRARLLDDIVGSPRSGSDSHSRPLSLSPFEQADVPQAGTGRLKVVKDVLPHDSVADEMIRQLLHGHDATSVLEGKAALDAPHVSRLERLILARGGQVGGDAYDGLVGDSELFDDGELDSLLRSPDEAASFARTARWRDIEANHKEWVPGPGSREQAKRTGRGRRGPRAGGRVAVVRRSKVTPAMKAFAERLLKGEAEGEEEGGGEELADFGTFQAMVAAQEEGDDVDDGDDEEEEKEGDGGGEGMDGETLAAYAQARWGYDEAE